VGEIHDALERTLGSQIHKDAKISPEDRNKIDAEMKGERRPTAGSAYAQGLIRLARLDPPTVSAPPPPTSALDPMWQRDTVFVRSLSSFHGELRIAARNAGFTGIAVQLDHSDDVGGNVTELNLIGNELVGNGWKIFGWATGGQGVDPSIDGGRHATIRRQMDNWLDGWISNHESWSEGADSWKSKAWIDAWRKAGGFGPLAVSCLSSDNPNWARSFDYKSWLDIPGAAVMPQVYGASFPAYTVQNCLSTMTNGGVPRNRLNLTFDVIGGAGPFADYRTWNGPRSIWTGDDSTVSTWLALHR
jgi:hypothetical protein